MEQPRTVTALPPIHLLPSPGWRDYALLDSGGGWKLEQFGEVILSRPEPEAIWKPALPEKRWRAAHALFQPSPEENGGHWDIRAQFPARWTMRYRDLTFWAQTSNSRHLGVFPEQAAHWDWIAGLIHQANHPLKVLNLFGYTGLATLAAAQAGARVTHVDAARKAISWARENQSASGLDDRPIRWLVDDAIKFVQREARRGEQYDGLILDPPKFGRGPKGEVWEFYKLIPALLQDCRAVLAPKPTFVVLTAYAIKASALTVYYAMRELTAGLGGEVSAGELVTVEQSAGRILSNAIYARWNR
jgi:23S rRNA (cytosine1962-C5)-methyltransferase